MLHVLPAQLINLRTGAFIRTVLEPYRAHVSKFWSDKSVDHIQDDLCKLCELHAQDDVLRAGIDVHDLDTEINDA